MGRICRHSMALALTHGPMSGGPTRTATSVSGGQSTRATERKRGTGAPVTVSMHDCFFSSMSDACCQLTARVQRLGSWGLARWRRERHHHYMRVRFILFAVALPGCHGAAPREAKPAPQRTALMDSATIRLLCAEPDSVLAGRRSCVLLNQAAVPRIFRSPPR